MRVSIKSVGNLLKWAFVNVAGRTRNERIPSVLIKIAYWTRFSRWCIEHATPHTGFSIGRQYDYERRYALYESVVQSEGLNREPIDYLEFGVYRGNSLRWWLERITNPESRFVGFDSFHGLPESWGGTPTGTFSTEGQPPDMGDPRCSFEIGLFQITLPSFLRLSWAPRRTVVHCDADLYSSTLFVLASTGPHLKAGDLVFFDDFSSPQDEFRAFYDFFNCFGLRYEVVGAANDFTQVCVKLL